MTSTPKGTCLDLGMIEHVRENPEEYIVATENGMLYLDEAGGAGGRGDRGQMAYQVT